MCVIKVRGFIEQKYSHKLCIVDDFLIGEAQLRGFVPVRIGKNVMLGKDLVVVGEHTLTIKSS